MCDDGKGKVIIMEREDELEGTVRPPLALATRGVSRFRGLLLTREEDGVLLLAPCNDIHTVGMRDSIDVAFVDRVGCVVEVHRSVGPFRRLRNRKAAAVMERFATCHTPWFEQGDRLAVSGFAKEGVAE